MFVAKELQENVFNTMIGQLTATLATSNKAKKSLEDSKHEASDKLFSNNLAVLPSYDGKSKL
jgi:hypothetical protein